MTYLVEKFRGGALIGIRLWTKSLDETKQFARDSLVRHQLDFVRISDLDGSRTVIWRESRYDNPRQRRRCTQTREDIERRETENSR